MKILSIETSCDETAAAVIEKTDSKVTVLSNIIYSQIEIHKQYGGVFPEIASRAHAEQIIPIIKKALGKFKIQEDIDLISVTAGPGLIGSLLVGVNAAKTLAYTYNKPILPVNHWLGHIYSTFDQESKIQSIRQAQDRDTNSNENLPQFPLLALIVSGGHTGLVLMKSHTEIIQLGETLDDAAGEAFDKVAKLLELNYPGGPEISRAAARFKKSGLKTEIEIKFPRAMLDRKDNFDFSFSGIKTSVSNKVKDLTKEYSLDEIRDQIAYEFQQCVIDILIGKTLLATEKYEPKSICLCGGVSANKELRVQMAKAMEDSTISFHVPPMKLTGDNAVMIGLATAYQIGAGVKPTTYKNINANSNLKL